jgi:hypothetical protein
MGRMSEIAQKITEGESLGAKWKPKNRYIEMETALKVIHTWASVDLEHPEMRSSLDPRHVLNLCKKALGVK